MGRTLLLWFLVISIVPLVLVDWMTYSHSRESLLNSRVEALSSVVELKRAYVDNYFEERLNDLLMESDLKANVDLLLAARKSFLESNMPLEDFVKSYVWNNLVSEKGADLLKFAQAYEYYDVFLIDHEGNILFSVMQESDLGTNLVHGTYSGTAFGDAFREAMAEGRPVCSDLIFYEPSGHIQALFMLQTMVNDEGDKVGMMAFQIPVNELDAIITDTTGLGATGQSYLVGSDLLMRSHARFSGEDVVLKQRVDTAITRAWMAGIKGETTEFEADFDPLYDNYEAVPVLGQYRSMNTLQRLGLEWAVVAEIRQIEVFESSNELRNRSIGMVGLMAMIVLILAVLVTGRILLPIRRISKWAQRVAIGDLEAPLFETPSNEIGELRESFGQVVASIRSVTSVCEAISVGDFEQSVHVGSEQDVLGRSVNQMAENLRFVVRQAHAIADGDYTVEVKPKSERDKLGLALSNMTRNLTELKLEKEKQDWLKTGSAELYECLRGEHNLLNLSRNVIRFLAVYLKAPIGAFYSTTEEGHLKMTGSYAFQARKNLANVYAFGEGLVGQAALEQDMILLTQPPEDYIHIHSGLGEAVPGQIVVIPFLFETNVMGVVELGLVNPLEQVQETFLRKAMTDVGIAVNTAMTRTRTEALLHKTREQADTLKNGQEELARTNRELEEQARALKVSEARLQQQQEELQQTNGELEERTQDLELQRDEIRKKNMELERAQNEIAAKAEDLERSSLYKSQFLANMSHELRTPLNSLLILAQMLRENKESNLSPRQVEFAETIHQSGMDLLNLINEILDLSKIEAGQMKVQMEKVELGPFLEALETRFRPIAGEKSLGFVIDRASDCPETIRTDPQRAGQVITNLLSNAFKFTNRGRVSLKVFTAQLPDSSDNLLAFEVNDTGPGISEADQNRIFEAFQQADGTTSRKHGGTGLGLSISRELARLLAGRIHLESTPGQGSTFTLFLPLAELEDDAEDTQSILMPKGLLTAPPQPKQQNPAESNPAPVVRVRESKLVPGTVDPHTPEGFPMDDRASLNEKDRVILIVEDDPKFAKIMMDMIRERGFKGLLAEDGETGLYLADFFKPDAIILDIGLPRMDGMSVMSRLKDNPDTRAIPVHVISGHDRLAEARKMGAVGYLRKPASLRDLDGALTQLDKVISKPVKNLLLVENDAEIERDILDLLGGSDIQIRCLAEGNKVLEALKTTGYDTMILDYDLPDMGGLELLHRIRETPEIPYLPIIIYANRDLTEQEISEVDPFVESIVAKTDKITERLLDETILFMHRLEKDLGVRQRRILRMVHDKESIFRDKQILVVDDDMRNVFAISSVLEEKGIKVIVGKNGRKGLEKLEENPYIDLVLMDVMMPEMDGYETIAAIRAQDRFQSLPIIALTAKAMKADRKKCIDAGANDYLPKPLDTVKLFSLMRVWLY